MWTEVVGEVQILGQRGKYITARTSVRFFTSACDFMLGLHESSKRPMLFSCRFHLLPPDTFYGMRSKWSSTLHVLAHSKLNFRCLQNLLEFHNLKPQLKLGCLPSSLWARCKNIMYFPEDPTCYFWKKEYITPSIFTKSKLFFNR